MGTRRKGYGQGEKGESNILAKQAGVSGQFLATGRQACWDTLYVDWERDKEDECTEQAIYTGKKREGAINTSNGCQLKMKIRFLIFFIILLAFFYYY